MKRKHDVVFEFSNHDRDVVILSSWQGKADTLLKEGCRALEIVWRGFFPWEEEEIL